MPFLKPESNSYVSDQIKNTRLLSDRVAEMNGRRDLHEPNIEREDLLLASQNTISEP